jgi:3-isopropylmalate dehydrogenase
MSPLRPELAATLDVLLVREVTGGALAGHGGRRTMGPEGAVAEDTGRYGEADVRRIVELACDLAAAREGSVTSVDKANAMATGALWREVAAGVSARRDDVRVKHLLVDAAAAGIVSDPGAFDVIVTENLFGDILSDVLGGLAGSIAVIPSASIGTGTGLFEPVHGSAPDLPARGVANPIGMIRTVAMLLDLGLGEPAPARAVEAALQRALSAGARTADIAQPGQPSLSTQGFGDAVLAHLEAGA